MKLLKKVRKIIQRQKLKKLNVILDKKINFQETTFEGRNYIGSNCNISKSEIGFGTYMGSGCRLNCISIGRYCSIGSDVKIVFGSHPTSKFISMHPAFYSIRKQAGFTYVTQQKYEELKFIDENKKIVSRIGNDVWLGEGVKILEGITIGDGAVVGAYSIVTKDVPPYTIYAGVPAKFIKNRFDDNQSEFLNGFKWWNKGEEWIEKNIEEFDNIQKFISINNI